MTKFIELTDNHDGKKIIIAVDKILAFHPCPVGTFVVLGIDRKARYGFTVSEGYDWLKCKLMGVFEGVSA